MNYDSNIAQVRPTDDINPKKKKTDKKWHLENQLFIWSYGNKYDDSPYANRDKFSTLRAYAEGRQSIDQYKTRFQTETDTDTESSSTSEYNSGITRKMKRRGLHNLDWGIVSVFPKFMNILLGKFGTTDHTISAIALDKLSGDEREDAKWRLYAKKELNSFYKQVYANNGLKYNEPSYLPEDIEELELYEQMGGFKLIHEQALDLIIQNNFDTSNWDKEIKDRLIRDLVAIGYAAVRDDINTQTNKIDTYYTDPSRVICQRISFNEHRRTSFWGYIEYYTIQELRQKGFKEDELIGFAKINSDKYGNPKFSEDIVASNTDTYSKPYDDYKIAVLISEYKSTDTFYDIEHTNQYGKIKIEESKKYGEIIDEDITTKNGKKIKNKTRVTRVNNFYTSKWIIDSDKVFEYGLKNGLPREGKDVFPSLHIVKLDGQSMVESCKTHLNELQLDFLMFQNARAAARPSGMAINIDAISNMKMGGKSMHPLEIMNIYRNSGDFLFKVTPMGIGGFGNNLGKPMEELKGGIGAIAVELMNDIEFRLRMIREATGINHVSDASDPNPNASVRGSEMALRATGDALRPIYKAYVTTKERVSKSITLRVQLLINSNKKAYEAYYPILGKNNLKALSIGERLSNASYAIKIEAVPTEKEKAELDQYITIGMQSGKNGIPLFDASQAFMLKGMLSANVPISQINKMLSVLEAKKKKMQAMKEQNSIAMQGKVKQQNDLMSFQLEQKKLQMVTDESIRLEKAKAIIKVSVEERSKQEYETRLAEMEHFWKMAEDRNKIMLENSQKEEKESVY